MASEDCASLDRTLRRRHGLEPAQRDGDDESDGDGDGNLGVEFVVDPGTRPSSARPLPPRPGTPVATTVGAGETDSGAAPAAELTQRRLDAEAGGPDGEAAAPAGDAAPDDVRGDRFCRICYDDSDGGEMGFLFSPCLCKGSCAEVHVTCLNTWRSMSANENSAFSCDMCKHQYKIGKREAAKLNFAQLIGHPWFAAVAASVLLLAIVIIVGILLEVFDYGELVNTVADLDVSMPTRVLSSGVSAVGMFGFLIQQMFWGGARMLFHFGNDRDGGGIMKAVVVLIGIVSTYYHIYGWVKDKVRDATYGGTMTILDVHGHVPGTPTPRPGDRRVVTEVD